MTSLNNSTKKKLPSELENSLPSEVRRTLLKAAWITPMITVINVPAHAQTSGPDAIIASLEFSGENRDGLITGQVEEASTKSAGAFTMVGVAFASVDFTGWTVELEVTVVRVKDGGGEEPATKTFTVAVNPNGSFSLPLAEDAIFDEDTCGDDSNENSLIRIEIRATLFDPDGNERDLKPLTVEYTGDGDPGEHSLVGFYPCV